MTHDKPFILDLASIGNRNIGFITIAEFPMNVPFEIKRAYWTYYTPHNVIRGNHAHLDLQQLIIALSGRLEIETTNTLGEKNEFILDDPKKCLYIPPKYWRTIKFSHSAVLLCLASKEYNEDDYIRDYEEFKKL